MKQVDIIIPTRNRLEKLLRMLKSIPEREDLFVHIAFDGDVANFRKLIDIDLNSGFEQSKEWTKEHLWFYCFSQRGSVACRNSISQKCEDAILYSTDDIRFEEGSIESAIASMKREFPDDDGVVGFYQHNAPNNNFCWTGVALVGQKFLLRYPYRRIGCPEYYHFSTREVEYLAKPLEKLFCDKNAKIFHYHPDFYKEEMDQTHKDARIYKAKDMALKERRKENGLIWGMNNEK